MSRAEALPTIPNPNLIHLSRTTVDRADSSLLIQVPRVASASCRGISTQPPNPYFSRPQARWRPRRRLRRKFRVAAVAAFALLPVPLALAMTCWPSRLSEASASSHVPSGPSSQTAAAECALPAPVWLSVESVGTGMERDDEPPVSLPGYLLPDDIHEEPAHAGG